MTAKRMEVEIRTMAQNTMTPAELTKTLKVLKTAKEAKLTKVAVAGGSGYAGQELIRLLAQHPNVNLTAIGTNSHDGDKFSDINPGFAGMVDNICTDLN